MPLAGLAAASLQVRGAQCVEQEALVGASKGTFQPGRKTNSMAMRRMFNGSWILTRVTSPAIFCRLTEKVAHQPVGPIVSALTLARLVSLRSSSMARLHGTHTHTHNDPRGRNESFVNMQ